MAGELDWNVGVFEDEAMKLLILGSGRHGKDSVAEIIRDLYGLSFMSSSRATCEEVVYPAIKDKYGYESPEDCYNDRSNHRQEWFDLISAYNTPDKSSLAKLILSRCDVYVGLRCPVEFEASRHLFDHVLWVDASERLHKEPSMRIDFDPDTMILINNNGSEYDLGNEIVSKLKGIVR